MSYAVLTMNAEWTARFRQFFRPRDLFLHDGRGLRRIALGSRVQIAAAAFVMLMLAWSLFAAVQFASGAFAAQDRSAEMAAKEHHVAALQVALTARQAAIAAKAAELKQQQAVLDTLLSARYQATAAELKRLGLKPARFGDYHGMGGPFEALVGDKGAGDAGDPQFKALFTSWKKLDALEQGVISIPSTKPVQTATYTSGFGVRSDPFRGGAAMHAGIDLAGPIGTPVYATADGVVGRAELVNGYGNLVELEHGKGIQTRYGHLSKILVKPNMPVKRGQLIALMGSTGRSTGSHLHYEVRIDGHAVNPVPFMQSTEYLIAVQRRAAATQVALGGPEDANGDDAN